MKSVITKIVVFTFLPTVFFSCKPSPSVCDCIKEKAKGSDASQEILDACLVKAKKAEHKYQSLKSEEKKVAFDKKMKEEVANCK